MQLPVSAIVHSGGKSIHALVRVDAADMQEYRKRVDYLYKTAEKYGLKVDGGNRNPSRLSRMPGVSRAGNPQYMISGPAGLPNWEAWINHVEDLKDDLPDPEPLSKTFDDLPDLAPALIDGILRVGHKLAVTGPSKAGKSFALIELAAAIAEGKDWLGMDCRQGPVLYVDLELDRVSCLHRFRDVYRAHGWVPENISKIDIWNLRGNSVPLDRLAPKLIRRAQKRGYLAVIIDPIYKVLTGDENSAEDMAKFCNQFDRIALGLGCAVIYVHHHSKGDQGGKRAIDRASGSGVFGRDPDAVLDLLELTLTKERRAELESKVICEALDAFIPTIDPDRDNRVEEEARAPAESYLMAAQLAYPKQTANLSTVRYNAAQKAAQMTGWRVDATLREFAPGHWVQPCPCCVESGPVA
jgi:RecA-family ATPase